MKNSDRANKRKWEAIAAYLLKLRKDPRTKLVDIAIQYNISQSTVSYGLVRLMYPAVTAVSKINANPTLHFKRVLETNYLTPSYIKELYDRCNIPIPAILKYAVNEEGNNNNIQSEPMPEKDTTPEENATPTQNCVKCDTALIPNASFCHNCGAPAPISKPKALTICNGLAEIIKFALPDKHKAMCLTWLERVKDYIEQTEE